MKKVAAIVISLATVVDARAFQLDFERPFSELPPGINASYPGAKDAIVRECRQTRPSNCFVKFTIRNSPEYISQAAHRAEMDNMRQTDMRYGSNSRFHYSFSFLIDDNWEIDTPQSIDILWQFKRFSSGPDMFIAVKGNSLVLRVLDNAQITIVEGLPRNTWLTVKMDVYWSTTEGTVRGNFLLPNGDSKSFQYLGPNAHTSKIDEAYVKWGIYKPNYSASNSTKARTLLMDNINIERLPLQ